MILLICVLQAIIQDLSAQFPLSYISAVICTVLIVIFTIFILFNKMRLNSNESETTSTSTCYNIKQIFCISFFYAIKNELYDLIFVRRKRWIEEFWFELKNLYPRPVVIIVCFIAAIAVSSSLSGTGLSATVWIIILTVIASVWIQGLQYGLSGYTIFIYQILQSQQKFHNAYYYYGNNSNNSSTKESWHPFITNNKKIPMNTPLLHADADDLHREVLMDLDNDSENKNKNNNENASLPNLNGNGHVPVQSFQYRPASHQRQKKLINEGNESMTSFCECLVSRLTRFKVFLINQGTRLVEFFTPQFSYPERRHQQAQRYVRSMFRQLYHDLIDRRLNNPDRSASEDFNIKNVADDQDSKSSSLFYYQHSNRISSSSSDNHEQTPTSPIPPTTAFPSRNSQNQPILQSNRERQDTVVSSSNWKTKLYAVYFWMENGIYRSFFETVPDHKKVLLPLRLLLALGLTVVANFIVLLCFLTLVDWMRYWYNLAMTDMLCIEDSIRYGFSTQFHRATLPLDQLNTMGLIFRFVGFVTGYGYRAHGVHPDIYIQIAYVALSACGILSFILFLFSCSSIMSKYRENMLRLRQGKLNISKSEYRVASTSQLIGIQIIYGVVGLLAFLIFLCIIAVFIVILYLSPAARAWLSDEAVQLLSWVFTIVLIVGLVRYMIQFLYADSQDPSSLLDPRFRRSFAITDYFNIFVYLLPGLWLVFARIILSPIVLFLYLFRIDQPILPRAWEHVDVGYAAYVTTLLVDHQHNNPILRTFVRMILDEYQITRRAKMKMSAEEFTAYQRKKKARLLWEKAFVFCTLKRCEQKYL